MILLPRCFYVTVHRLNNNFVSPSFSLHGTFTSVYCVLSCQWVSRDLLKCLEPIKFFTSIKRFCTPAEPSQHSAGQAGHKFSQPTVSVCASRSARGESLQAPSFFPEPESKGDCCCLKSWQHGFIPRVVLYHLDWYSVFCLTSYSLIQMETMVLRCFM